MKLIRYFGVGTVPGAVNQKGDKKARTNIYYRKWLKETVEQFKELGVPSKPFRKIFKAKIEITHPQWVKQKDHKQSECIFNALKEAGIITDDNFYNIRSIELRPDYSYMNGSFIVTLFIEEDDTKNKGIVYDDIKICKDLEITKLYSNGHF